MPAATKNSGNVWLATTTTAIVGAIVGFAVYYLVPAINAAFSGGCEPGWAGFGCAIIAALASLTLSAVVGGLIAFILLRASKVPDAAWIAAGGSVLSGSLIFGTYKNLGQGFTAALIWTVITVSTFLLVFLAFHFAKGHKKLAMAAIVVVAIILYVFGGRVASSINTAAFNNQQARTVQSAGFAVYLPRNVPANYVFDGGVLTGQPGMPGSGPEMYRAEYYEANDTLTQFSIMSLEAPSTYNPPTNCGPAQPNNSWQTNTPCQKIGESAQGDPIYLGSTKTINGNATFAVYVRINQTLVTLTPAAGTELSNDDILKAFTSLKAYSGHNLAALLNGKQ